MEDDLNGRQPQWKTTSMEDDLNGRQPQWKTTSMEDDLNGRRHQVKIIHKSSIISIVGATSLAQERGVRLPDPDSQ